MCVCVCVLKKKNKLAQPSLETSRSESEILFFSFFPFLVSNLGFFGFVSSLLFFALFCLFVLDLFLSDGMALYTILLGLG